jgi:hypothetical protein
MIVNSGFPCHIQKMVIKKSFSKCRIMKRAQFTVIIYCETRTRKNENSTVKLGYNELLGTEQICSQ